ncbi:MAG: hypothetical protein B7Y36_02375 [Novosphingobium sp. 28-62-57]|nr:MAG: hypothetical protein B7Z34_08235 [Novosphingobium sp. 12-62-10]OYZ12391.1 MAG: hypothetical protein B7Y36_02375 [Novosphingobium sp. 28-62-57]OZA36048.1 MAG: hypothetical protein B7X92_07915 [Novosphingobium sp. 17-62-9]
MDIIRLGAGDAERYVALRKTILESEAANFRSSKEDNDRIALSAWQERLAHDHVFVARQVDAWLAVGGLTRMTGGKLDHKGLVWGMYVSPAARGNGAAGQILHHLEHAARTLGLRLLQLTVMADNLRARRLYERYGFELYGIEPESVRREDGFADEALMWKRL